MKLISLEFCKMKKRIRLIKSDTLHELNKVNLIVSTKINQFLMIQVLM